MSPSPPASAPAYTSLDTEHFLSFLFGKESTHGLASGLLDEGTWRRYRRKVLRELRRYIDTNVVGTDASTNSASTSRSRRSRRRKASASRFFESRRSLPSWWSSVSSFSGRCWTTGNDGS